LVLKYKVYHHSHYYYHHYIPSILIDKPVEHACTYVIGVRKQKWAYLGGEIDDLCGETAISVRLSLNGDSSSSSSSSSSVNVTKTVEELKQDYIVPPIGSFRKHCNICKQPYDRLHSFYHQLCPRCGDFNLEKRLATSNLNGFIAVVTGGRVRIGKD